MTERDSSGLSRGVSRLYSAAASKETALILFVVFGLVLIPDALTEKKGIVPAGLQVLLLGLIGLNLMLCTLKRIRALSKPVLILHGGVLIIIAGGAISSYGFVATVNMYEGTTVDKAYNWDIGRDIPLGVDLTLKNIHIEYYPSDVKVGVLKGNEKSGLYKLKTGESFLIDGYEVRADELKLPDERLALSVLKGGRLIGTAGTKGESSLPPGFPYNFRLVAYKTPSVRRMWIDIGLTTDTRAATEGSSEVNSPLSWEGLSFHHVRVDHDSLGVPYAGIQITRDPGRPFVYTGFAITGIGALAYLGRRTNAI